MVTEKLLLFLYFELWLYIGECGEAAGLFEYQGKRQ